MPHASNSKPEITVEMALAAYEQCGRSMRKAAEILDCDAALIKRRLTVAQRRLTIPPLAPAVPDGFQVSKISTSFDKDENVRGQHIQARPEGLEPDPDQIIPPGHLVKGVSTYLRDDGTVGAQWVKTRLDEEQRYEQTVRAIRETFADSPKVEPIPAPKICDSKLLTVYPIGDHHVAMYSWGEETGADYDIKTADHLLTSAAAHLVDVSPASETALIIDLGDFFHVDNIRNQTSRSGNTLDVDTRHAAMIRAGVKMLRSVVECALRKHKFVKLIVVIGNHNDLGALWLQMAFSLLYENNPRVTIETKPGKFHYHQHGKVLIGTTHGDTGKPEKVQGVMAADMPKAWGETQFRYWFTGHVHTRKVVEFPGVMWETFRTLAPNDAWAQAAAYRSGRDMTSVVLHDEYGEVERHRFDVAMLDAA